MLGALHEFGLWTSFTVVIGLCVYFNPVAGIDVGLLALAFQIFVERRAGDSE